jgi:peroxiredoxin
MDIPKNLNGVELFKFLKENKGDIEYARKNTIKFADSVNVVSQPLNKELVAKSVVPEEKTEVKIRAIINTTNVMDSHKDVHIDGLWNKSLSENRNIKFLKEHKMEFENIIADKEDLEVSVNSVTWKSLGFDMEGKTEALTFDAVVKQDRNPSMFKEYSKNNVDNHSVGMQYVKMALAINSEDEDFTEEKEVWDKYYPSVANKEELKKNNFFWAVTEAKVIEGSAVVIGSNSFTPTQSTKHKEGISSKELAIKEWLGIEEAE